MKNNKRPMSDDIPVEVNNWYSSCGQTYRVGHSMRAGRVEYNSLLRLNVAKLSYLVIYADNVATLVEGIV